jgi:hypothetical protein
VTRAASYVVRSCSNGSTSGWTGWPATHVSSTCGSEGGALHARVDGAPQEPAAWTFQAPPDTDIEGFTVVRGYWRNAGVPFGTPVYQLQTLGPGASYFWARPNFAFAAIFTPPSSESATGLTGQTALEVAVVCGGGGECLHPAASLDIFSAAITLRDAFPPTVERVSGSLLADGPLAGIRTLRYTAADQGGGVARTELSIDGVPMEDQVADVNEGACTPGEGEFATVVPCKLRASNTLTFDTRRVPDGPHVLGLRVLDATRSNHGDWTARIVVDNVPPPANQEPPSISGEAREGATLVASPGVWTATRPTFAYRWQRYDGRWSDVPDATSAAYVAGADDVGHRLRVRVTAVDAEGSGVAYSASTARVVAGPADDDGLAGGAPPPGPAGSGAPAPAPPAAPRLGIDAGLGSAERSSLTIPYGRAVAVRGTVRDATGAPARGVALALLAATTAGRWHRAGATWTNDNGRFTILAGPGPSRRLVVAAGAVRSRPLRLAVRAAVRLRTARQGRWTVLRGALEGGHVPPGGVLVTIQARRRGHWVARTTLVTDRRGRFHGRVAGPPPLRVAVPSQPGYPFAPGTSAGRP